MLRRGGINENRSRQLQPRDEEEARLACAWLLIETTDASGRFANNLSPVWPGHCFDLGEV